jgi:hypothetical protein
VPYRPAGLVGVRKFLYGTPSKVPAIVPNSQLEEEFLLDAASLEYNAAFRLIYSCFLLIDILENTIQRKNRGDTDVVRTDERYDRKKLYGVRSRRDFDY